MGKLKIEPDSVQETLIIPLYARKLCAEAFPSLYRGESAARICAGLEFAGEAAARRTGGATPYL